MKKIFSVFILLPAMLTLAQAQGIEFFHGSWPEALEKAKTEQKLIFVDAYASWCGPCKRMASTVFTDQEVGDYFNANFIPLKIDMEKPENAEFAGKYPVRAYPTLYFIDAEGKVVVKNVGAMSAEQIIEFGKKALGSGDNAVDYEKGYAEGNRDPQFLYDYVRWLNRQGKPSLKVTNEYLNTQKDFTTPFNLKFILEGATEADSRVFDLLVKNRDAIAKQEGEEKVNARVEAAAKSTVKKAIEFRSEDLLKEAKTKYGQARPDRARVFGYDADMQYYAAV
ncbi:MAG TPA: thioredoxin domain-containing protein, partial [Saprospiraceae bacterium]|nr:thioredoxin domain-containing protein [Saprospiraceae bacterium]